jgi:hypothetical protein
MCFLPTSDVKCCRSPMQQVQPIMEYFVLGSIFICTDLVTSDIARVTNLIAICFQNFQYNENFLTFLDSYEHTW